MGVFLMGGPARFFIFIGIAMVSIGLLIALAQRLGLGRLPGDIVIEKDRFTLVLPLASCVIISGLLTFLFWLISRLRG